MKPHHSSGIGYAETLQIGDVFRQPGCSLVITVVSEPEQVGNGIGFIAAVKTGAPGTQYHDIHWHRHTLVMEAGAKPDQPRTLEPATS